MPRSALPGREVNVAELAAIVGTQRQSVMEWIARGCPVVAAGGRGKQYRLNTKEVIAWLLQRAKTDAIGRGSNSARDRKAEADAAMAELNLAKARGEVVHVADAAAEFERSCSLVRTRLLAVPQKVAPLVAIEANPAACQQLVAEEIGEALHDLAGGGDQAAAEGDPSPGPGSGAPPSAEAAAQAHGQPVG